MIFFITFAAQLGKNCTNHGFFGDDSHPNNKHPLQRTSLFAGHFFYADIGVQSVSVSFAFYQAIYKTAQYSRIYHNNVKPALSKPRQQVPMLESHCYSERDLGESCLFMLYTYGVTSK